MGTERGGCLRNTRFELLGQTKSQLSTALETFCDIKRWPFFYKDDTRVARKFGTRGGLILAWLNKV